MNRGIAVTTLIVGALALPAIALSQSARPPAQGPASRDAPPALLSPSVKNPYAKLFGARPAVKGSQLRKEGQVTQATMGESEVRCGIVVVPANPEFDSGIRVGPTTPFRTKYTMGLIEPPCPAVTAR